MDIQKIKHNLTNTLKKLSSIELLKQDRTTIQTLVISHLFYF